jgi:hypothetical protein
MPMLRLLPPFAGFSLATWMAIVLSVCALFLCLYMILRLRRRPTEASGEKQEEEEEEREEGDGSAGIPDVLGSVLKRAQVPESDGVRWDIVLYPGTLSVPGYAVLTAILQNAYDLPRVVSLEIAPDPLLPQGHAAMIALKGGEAGILRTPLFISGTLPVERYSLRATIRAQAPRGEGKRLIRGSGRQDRGARSVSLHVTSHHGQAPVNLFAYEWKGYSSLYIPPQTAPDLTELRILEELLSIPAEND